MTDFIPFALHDIDEDDIKEVVATLRSNWITTGPKAKLFEESFAKYIGSKYALAVNSATAGLHLALESIGLEEADLVITTPYTFTATAEVIRYFKADPIFIDINESDYNIDPEKIEEFCKRECVLKGEVLYHKSSGRPVKAIVPVHIGGYPCDMDAILSIGDRYHLKIVEDAAHALPSRYKTRKIGTVSDITVFSFYPTKAMTTGEGGMLVTDNPEHYKRIKIMRLHGISRDVWERHGSKAPGWYYEVIGAGFKYNMTDIAASLGLTQLKKLDRFHERRREIASIYNKELNSIDALRLPRYKSDRAHAWHLYIVELVSKRFSRDELIKWLYERGVGVGVHYIPLHLHPYYKNRYNFSPEDFPIAYGCYKRVMSLPIYTKMSDKDVFKVVNTIKDLLS